MKEIGSEFWIDEQILNGDICNTLSENCVEFSSGRTALDFIIKDIKSNRNAKVVYFPSYCCDSMIDPFLKNDIKVIFYSVSYNQNDGGLFLDIDSEVQCDIFYMIEYFGFSGQIDNDIIATYKKKGTTIINDKTHSVFCESLEKDLYADYTYVSYRKWFFVPGYATAENHRGDFSIEKPKKENERYVKLRIEASELKKEYILTGKGEKQRFLKMYNESEDLLYNDYVGFGVDEVSKRIFNNFNFDELKTRRRKNSRYLLSRLKEMNEIKPLFNEIKENECPLFVPILINEHDRDRIRNQLISNQVFCPIHWPIPKQVNQTSLYNSELSLVCDQRYTIDDMERIYNVLISNR